MSTKTSEWFNDPERMKKIHKFITDQMEADKVHLDQDIAYLDKIIRRELGGYGFVLTAVVQDYKNREGFDPDWDLTEEK